MNKKRALVAVNIFSLLFVIVMFLSVDLNGCVLGFDDEVKSMFIAGSAFSLAVFSSTAVIMELKGTWRWFGLLQLLLYALMLVLPDISPM